MTGVEIWQHINESLKIVLWPAVAACAFFTLRHKIKDRVGDLESVESPALTARFGKGKELDVAPAVDAILDKASERDADIETDQSQNGPAEKGFDLLDVRQEIEQIIRMSFKEGVLAGRSIGHNPDWSDPEPEIKWTGSQPYVGFYLRRIKGHAPPRDPTKQSDDGLDGDWERRIDEAMRRQFPENEGVGPAGVSMTQYRQAVDVATIEAEMVRLAKEIRDAGGPIKQQSNRRATLWLELQEKLRRLDPDSPLARAIRPGRLG